MKRMAFVILASMLISCAACAEEAIAYYGKLLASSDVEFNGNVPLQIEFRLYRNAEPGETTALWGRRISVKLDEFGSFYTELRDSAGTDTGRASYKSLAEAVASACGGDVYISLTPVGYGELLPRKKLNSVHRSEYAAVVSSANKVKTPLLTGESAAIARLDAGGNFTITKSFVSSGGKIVNTFDGTKSSATLGADGGKVVFSNKFNYWNNMTMFSSASHVCSDALFGWRYSEKYGAFVIPHPIDTSIHSRDKLSYIQQFLMGNYSALWD